MKFRKAKLLHHIFVFGAMSGINYKKFRESKKEYFDTKEGKLTKQEVIRKLETWLKQRLGEPQEFFDNYEVKEAK